MGPGMNSQVSPRHLGEAKLSADKKGPSVLHVVGPGPRVNIRQYWSDQTNELWGLLILKSLIFGTDASLHLALSFQAQLSWVRGARARIVLAGETCQDNKKRLENADSMFEKSLKLMNVLRRHNNHSPNTGKESSRRRQAEVRLPSYSSGILLDKMLNRILYLKNRIHVHLPVMVTSLAGAQVGQATFA